MPQSELATPIGAYLGEWEPVAVGTTEAYRLYARTLNRGVAQRCQQALAPDGAAAVTLAEQVMPRLGESGWTSPALAYAWFVGLADGSTSPESAVDELERVVASDPPPLSLAPDGLPQWLRYAQRGLIADRKRGAPAVDPELLSPDTETLESCTSALALLEQAWPEMAGTTTSLVRELRWIGVPEGYSHGSGTVPQAFGAVFLTPTGRLGLFESIVHESSHLELTVRMALDKLIVNAQDRAASPLRPTKRPLSRVLHATFVCARIARAYEHCTELLPESDRDRARQRHEQSREGLEGGCRTLAEHCDWTPAGAAMFERMRADFSI